MILYPLRFEDDDNGTILVTCPVLPEVTTFGENIVDAIKRGRDAVEEALAARMAGWEDVPVPVSNDPQGVPLPLLTRLKLELYLACRNAGVSRADLVRRLGWHREQVDRLFRLDHASRVDQIEAAMDAVGQTVEVQTLRRAVG